MADSRWRSGGPTSFFFAASADNRFERRVTVPTRVVVYSISYNKKGCSTGPMPTARADGLVIIIRAFAGLAFAMKHG